MSVYTTTLTSDNILLVSQSADFGEIIISGLLLVLLAVAALDIVTRLVYHG